MDCVVHGIAESQTPTEQLSLSLWSLCTLLKLALDGSRKKGI